LEGCSQLTRRNIPTDLLTRAKQLYDQVSKSVVLTSSAILDLRAWLWALGHIGATDCGYNALANVDPAFVDWCVDGACLCPYFSLRGTFFHVLGLLSRSSKGAQRLHHLHWDCSAPSSNSAVALPRQPRDLFKRISLLSRTDSNSRKSKIARQSPRLPFLQASAPPSSVKLLTPFLSPGSTALDLEVLNLIVKVRMLTTVHITNFFKSTYDVTIHNSCIYRCQE
jgi:hypothetical protein